MLEAGEMGLWSGGKGCRSWPPELTSGRVSFTCLGVGDDRLGWRGQSLVEQTTADRRGGRHSTQAVLSRILHSWSPGLRLWAGAQQALAEARRSPPSIIPGSPVRRSPQPGCWRAGLRQAQAGIETQLEVGRRRLRSRLGTPVPI